MCHLPISGLSATSPLFLALLMILEHFPPCQPALNEACQQQVLEGHWRQKSLFWIRCGLSFGRCGHGIFLQFSNGGFPASSTLAAVSKLLCRSVDPHLLSPAKPVSQPWWTGVFLLDLSLTWVLFFSHRGSGSPYIS